MFRLYFVGGIFGAGKSILCQTLSRLLPGEHLKASELIRYATSPNDPTGKSTGQVLSNQERLIAAVALPGSLRDSASRWALLLAGQQLHHRPTSRERF